MGRGFDIANPDGTVVHVPIPLAPKAPYGGFASRPNDFSDAEHNRLSGRATFIEDMDERELMKYWSSYYRAEPRHTAREWRQYYEENVRPAYLEKMAQRSAAFAPELTQNIKQRSAAPSPEALETIEQCPTTSPTNITTQSSQEITPVSSETTASFKTQVSELSEPLQAPTAGTENVETSPSALTAIHDEQPTSPEAEVKFASHDVTPESEAAYLQIIPAVSKPATLAAILDPNMMQPTISQIDEVINDATMVPSANTTSLPQPEAVQPVMSSKTEEDVTDGPAASPA
jgi:hypothetical protein